MAKQVCVAVRDNAMAAFMTPWFAPTIGSAVRAFGDEVNREGSPMGAHPSDYELWYLGEFDNEPGRLEPAVDVRQIARAVDQKREA